MSHNIVQLSPEENFFDQSYEDHPTNDSDKFYPIDSIKIINIPLQQQEILQIDDSLNDMDHKQQIDQQQHQDELDKQLQQVFENEFVNHEENIIVSNEGSCRLSISQRKIIVKQVTAPALFSSGLEEKENNFATFGNKQSVAPFEAMKKEQKKTLPKWDHLTKNTTDKENLQSVKILSKLVPDKKITKLCNKQNEIPRIKDKYPNVESKVKLALKQTMNNYHQSSRLTKNPVKSQKHFSDLNLSGIGKKQQRPSVMKVEDSSMLQDLIELDFSSMISQINLKKDFLMDKIKSLQKSNKPVEKSGLICKNGYQSKIKQDVGLIDLYSNMLSQKDRSQINRNKVSKPRSQSISLQDTPKCSSPAPRREPGKIVRQLNSVRKLNDETVRQLEFNYDSVISYAMEIQKQLQKFRSNDNNKYMSI